MSDLRVSCVVPAHNAERFLPAALESLLSQTAPVFEVIVADNGSTDRTAEIAASFGGPVRVLAVDPGPIRDPAIARNAGLRAVRGELICFLDSDDLYEPTKTERQLERFDADEGLGACFCTMENFWEPGLEEEEERYRAAGRLRAQKILSTLMLRTAVARRLGPIDEERTAGSISWVARLLEMDVAYDTVDEVLMRRRMHRDSFSHTEYGIEEVFTMLRARIARSGGAPL
jgi:glycosyltransferase involved in cell wall biosynthesis